MHAAASGLARLRRAVADGGSEQADGGSVDLAAEPDGGTDPGSRPPSVTTWACQPRWPSRMASRVPMT